MATIYHQVGIKAPLNRVYEAIATPDGVTQWWTPTSGDPNKGGKLDFSFDEDRPRSSGDGPRPDGGQAAPDHTEPHQLVVDIAYRIPAAVDGRIDIRV